MRISDWSSDVCSSDLAFFLADQEGVIALGDDGRAVHVRHPDDHLDLVARARRIDRADSDDMIAGLVMIRRPLELTTVSDEQRPPRQPTDYRELQRVGVRVVRDDAED